MALVPLSARVAAHLVPCSATTRSALAASVEDGEGNIAEQGCRNAVSEPKRRCQYVGQERREGPDNSFSVEELPGALELCARAVPVLVG